MNDLNMHDHTTQLLTVYLGQQAFGIPTVEIEDVLRPLEMTSVPMAPLYIKGISNLRGRIVTAVDLRRRFGPECTKGNDSMNVVIESQGELFSILVDRVGDVLTLKTEDIEPVPITLSHAWHTMATGVHQLDGEILILLSPENVIAPKDN